MQSIPADLNEAAAVDGAGMFTRFFKITLPKLKSVSLVIVFIHIIWTALQTGKKLYNTGKISRYLQKLQLPLHIWNHQEN